MAKKRLIDKKIKGTQEWIKDSFVLINKKEIRTWQGVFIIAFCAGVFASLAWAVSSDFHPFSSAASNIPNNQCIAIPAGGHFDGVTNVRIKCGKYVRQASYVWHDYNGRTFEEKEIIDFKKGVKTIYNGNVMLGLSITGYASASGTPLMSRLSKAEGLVNKHEQNILELQDKINNTDNQNRIARLTKHLKKNQDRLQYFKNRYEMLESQINTINNSFDTTFSFYPTEKCIDSDGGYDNNIKGTVSINKNYGGYGYNIYGYGYGYNYDYYTDECNSKKTKVIEYYCNSRGYAAKKTITCPNGCSDGVCVTSDNTKPDLQAYFIGFSPAEPKPGDIVTVDAAIKNIGTKVVNDIGATGWDGGGAGTSTVVYIDGNVEKNSLNPGESTNVTIRWKYLQAGNYEIEIIADSGNQIDELREDNNIAKKVISVDICDSDSCAINDSKLYIKDGNVYYDCPGGEIAATSSLNIDISSVEIIDDVFFKDINNVYYVAIDSKMQLCFFKRLNESDPATFQILGKYYEKDIDTVYHNYYYWGGPYINIAPNVDAPSFMALDGGYYAKDKNRAYFAEDQTFVNIDEADVETFMVYEDDSLYARDKNNTYYRGGVTDPRTR